MKQLLANYRPCLGSWFFPCFDKLLFPLACACARGHLLVPRNRSRNHTFLSPSKTGPKLEVACCLRHFRDSVAGDACHLRWSWNHWSRCGKKPWPTRWRRGTGRESGGWSSFPSANVQPAFWIQNANHRHAKKKSSWTTSWWSGSKQWLSTFSLNMGTSFCKLSDTWKLKSWMNCKVLISDSVAQGDWRNIYWPLWYWGLYPK